MKHSPLRVTGRLAAGGPRAPRHNSSAHPWPTGKGRQPDLLAMVLKRQRPGRLVRAFRARDRELDPERLRRWCLGTDLDGLPEIRGNVERHLLARASAWKTRVDDHPLHEYSVDLVGLQPLHLESAVLDLGRTIQERRSFYSRLPVLETDPVVHLASRPGAFRWARFADDFDGAFDVQEVFTARDSRPCSARDE